jgi:branched-chain amino acid transport system substrate-binding protein
MKQLRKIGYLSTVLALSLAASACGGSEEGSGSDKVIKLGQVLPVNSVQAALAKTQIVGAQIAADELNADGGIDGNKIEIVVKDDKLEPARVGTVLRELNDEGVKLTLGFETSPECQAGAEAAVRLGQVVLANHCSSALLTNPKPASENFWMLSASGTEIAEAAGAYLGKSKGDVNTWDVFGYDADITRSNWKILRPAMEKAGNKSIKSNQEFWVPVDATNYRSQITKQMSGLKATKETRGLFLSTYGAGTTSYMKQAEPLGLLKDYSTVVTLGAYWSSALSMKGTSPDIYNVHEYFAGCQDNPMDQAFIKAYEAKMNTLPDAGAYQSYVGVKFYAAAIQKAGSADPTAVQKAFAGLSIDTPTGQKLTMDGDSHKADTPLTVAHLVGDPAAKDGIKVISCDVAP